MHKCRAQLNQLRLFPLKHIHTAAKAGHTPQGNFWYAILPQLFHLVFFVNSLKKKIGACSPFTCC